MVCAHQHVWVIAQRPKTFVATAAQYAPHNACAVAVVDVGPIAAGVTRIAATDGT
jgi:hypothetical protein